MFSRKLRAQTGDVATLILLAAALAGCQQSRPALVDRLLIGEVMMHAEFSGNLRTLAMPGGRLSGTPNAERATEFVAGKLREYGLKQVYFEPFQMHCWTVHATRVTLQTASTGDGSPPAPPRTLDGAIALARTISTPPDGISADLIDLGDGRDEDFAAHADDLAGKFALIRENHRRAPRVKLAMEHHAAGVAFMAAADREPVIGSGHQLPAPEPALAIRHDDDLVAQLARGDHLRLNVQLETENWIGHPNNVIGEIPGSGPLAREIVIVGAHIDSWHLAEGAMDNGSGSATILEAARALAHVGSPPHRTIRFIWFMGEEQGLEGSEAYVRQHADELPRIVAMINADMPGAPRDLVAIGHDEVVPFLRNLRDDLAAYELNPEITVTPGGDGSDYAPFVHHGVCGLAIGGELGPGVKGYHTAGDTFDTVDRRGTIPTAAIIAVLAQRLADIPQRPTQQSAATQPAQNPPQ